MAASPIAPGPTGHLVNNHHPPLLTRQGKGCACLRLATDPIPEVGGHRSRTCVPGVSRTLSRAHMQKDWPAFHCSCQAPNIEFITCVF